MNQKFSHVFLSYSRMDDALAAKLRERLEVSNLDVWIDTDLEHGTPEWEMAIEGAIDHAGCVLVVLSPNVKQSKWVRNELLYANARKKKIYPVLIEGGVADACPLGIFDVQVTDVTDLSRFLDEIDELIRSIADYLKIKNVLPDAVKLEDSKPPCRLDPWRVRSLVVLLYWLYFTPHYYVSHQIYVSESRTRWTMLVLVILTMFVSPMIIMTDYSVMQNDKTLRIDNDHELSTQIRTWNQDDYIAMICIMGIPAILAIFATHDAWKAKPIRGSALVAIGVIFGLFYSAMLVLLCTLAESVLCAFTAGLALAIITILERPSKQEVPSVRVAIVAYFTYLVFLAGALAFAATVGFLGNVPGAYRIESTQTGVMQYREIAFSRATHVVSFAACAVLVMIAASLKRNLTHGGSTLTGRVCYFAGYVSLCCIILLKFLSATGIR